jgi:hypothetical protein
MELIKASLMAVAGGGGGRVISRTFTANGTYPAPTGYDGFAPVTVDVYTYWNEYQAALARATAAEEALAEYEECCAEVADALGVEPHPGEEKPRPVDVEQAAVVADIVKEDYTQPTVSPFNTAGADDDSLVNAPDVGLAFRFGTEPTGSNLEERCSYAVIWQGDQSRQSSQGHYSVVINPQGQRYVQMDYDQFQVSFDQATGKLRLTFRETRTAGGQTTTNSNWAQFDVTWQDLGYTSPSEAVTALENVTVTVYT